MRDPDRRPPREGEDDEDERPSGSRRALRPVDGDEGDDFDDERPDEPGND